MNLYSEFNFYIIYELNKNNIYIRIYVIYNDFLMISIIFDVVVPDRISVLIALHPTQC
jgi:hypothetical protein